MVCCLFGHKETPASVAAELGKVIDHLIQERGVDEFLVGNQGAFDRMVHRALREARNRYPHISYHVVLAFLLNTESGIYEYSETFSRRELRMYHLTSQFPGAINGWFGNQISVSVILHIPGVARQRV